MSISDLMDIFCAAEEIAVEQDICSRQKNKTPLDKDDRQELVFRMRSRGTSTRLLAKILNVSPKLIRLDIAATQNLHYGLGNIPMAERKTWLGETRHQLKVLQQEAFVEYHRAEDGSSVKISARNAIHDLMKTEIELMTRIGVVNSELGSSAEHDAGDDLVGVSEDELKIELMRYFERQISTTKGKTIDVKTLPVAPPRPRGIISRRDPPKMEEEEDAVPRPLTTGTSAFGITDDEDE